MGFALFVAAELGSWVAILVYAYVQGGSTEAGIAAFVQLAPAALFAPLAGAAADRLGGLRVLVAGYVLQAATMAGTAVALVVDAPSWLVYVAAASAASAVTITRPTQAVVTPALSRSPTELGAVNVLSGWITAGGGLIAPGVAGVLVAAAGPGTVFFVAAGANALAGFLAAGVRIDNPAAGNPTRGGGTMRDAFHDIGVGIATVRAHAPLRLVVLLVGTLFLVVGAIDVLAVALALGKLDLGRGGAGYLTAAFGAGGLLGAAIGLALVGRRRLAPYLAAAALASGGSLVLIGAWTTEVAAFGLLVIAGAGYILFDVSAAVLLQRTAPTDVLSRTFSLAEALSMAGLAVGSLLVPVLVGIGGVRLALFGIGALLPVIVLLRASRILRIDDDAHVPVVEIALLRSMSMFALLPAAAVEGLARALTPLELPSEAVVITQGDVGDRFYVVADGKLEVSAHGRRVATLERGSGFGEIALLHDVPRTATVTALTDVRLYALEREDFLIALTGHASAQAAARNLADVRLQELADARPAVD